MSFAKVVSESLCISENQKRPVDFSHNLQGISRNCRTEALLVMETTAVSCSCCAVIQLFDRQGNQLISKLLSVYILFFFIIIYIYKIFFLQKSLKSKDILFSFV